MAHSKVGERYSVNIGISNGGSADRKNLVMYNDAAVAEFTLDCTLNHFPTGRARLVSKSKNTIAPASGTYGTLTFVGIDSSGNERVMPIYITTADRKVLSASVSAIDIEFEVGYDRTQAVMENDAFEGTSIEAMNRLFNTANMEVVDYVTNSKGPNGVGDSMVWRFVEGTLTEHLDTVVQHCVIPGDIAYWAYDEGMNKVKIGTYNLSKGSSYKRFLMYTHDAVQATSNAYKDLSGSNTKIWYYSGYSPEDLSGALRADRSPNLFIDSLGPNGEKEVGDCAAECWASILKTMGANPDYMETGKYSKQQVVKTFPMNTHKMYAVAPYVRRYMLAEYSKQVTLNLYNHTGPKLGACMHFYAESTNKREGDFLPDAEYTAKYIVVGKTITKNSTTNVGLLGRTVDTTSSDMVTTLTMVSNTGYSGLLGKEYKEVNDLAAAITKQMVNGGAK